MCMACPAFLLDLPSFTICTCVWKVPSHLSSKLCLLFPNTSTLYMWPEKEGVFFSLSFSRIIYLNPIFQAKNTLGAWKSYLPSLFSFSCSLAKTTNAATAQKQLFKENEKSTNSIFQNRWIQRIESYLCKFYSQTWLWGFIMLPRPIMLLIQTGNWDD